MGELEQHFIHELIVTDCLRDRNDLRVRRHLGNEAFGLELSQLLLAHAAGQHGDVVDVGVLDHGVEGVLGVVLRIHASNDPPKGDEATLGRG
jgi:hypothetical protein